METGRDIACLWVARMIMLGLHFTKKTPFDVRKLVYDFLEFIVSLNENFLYIDRKLSFMV